MAIIGSAYIKVHADTSAVRGEIERAFKGFKGIANDAGEQFGKDFADSFGQTLGDELDGLLPEALKQDVTRVAEEAAADYADSFSSSLSDELNDTVARALSEDSDGLSQQGADDAEAYGSGFAESLRAQTDAVRNNLGSSLDGLLPDLLDQDVSGVADQAAADYADNFSEIIGIELGDTVAHALRDESAGIGTQGQSDAKEYSSGFSETLRDGLANLRSELSSAFDGLIPELLDEDVSTTASGSAKSYADSYAEKLSAALDGVVAKALARDSESLKFQAEQDAGHYATGFAEAINAHLSGLIDSAIAGTDFNQLGGDGGAAYASGFADSVTSASPDFTPNIDTSELNRDSFDAGDAAAAAAAAGLEQGVSRRSGGIGGSGSSFGDHFFGGIFSAFNDTNAIEAASKSVTQLIATSNLIGPAIGQAVASLSSLAQGLFAVGAAAAQATPALVVLPGILGSFLQAGIATGIAFKGVGAALKIALNPDSTLKDVQFELKGLVPAAQEFVLAMRANIDAFTALKDAAATGLFPGLTEALDNIVNGAFPLFQDILESTTTAVGELAAAFSEKFVDPSNLKNFGIVADNNVQTIRTLGGAMIDLGIAFTSALAAAAPLITRFTTWVGTVASSISSFLQVNAATGDLTDTFQEAGDVAAKLGDIFGNVAEGIGNLAAAASPAGQSLLDSFAGVTENFVDLTQASLSSGEAFTRFGAVAENFREIGTFARQLIDIFLDLGADNSVAETFRVLQTAVPSIRDIAEAFTQAGPALAQLAVSAAEFIAAFTETEGIQTFLNVLTSIVSTITNIIQTPVISDILQLLIPIVAATRAIQFFFLASSTLIVGLLGSFKLIVPAITSMTGSLGKFLAETKVASAGGVGLGTAITGSMAKATIATNATTAATTRLAVAQKAATGAAAFSNFVPRGGVVPAVVPAAVPAAAAKSATLAARAASGLRIASTALIGVAVSPWALAATAAVAGLGAIYLNARGNVEEYEARVASSGAALAQSRLETGALSAEVIEGSDAWKAYVAAVGEGSADLGEFKAALTGGDEGIAALSEKLVALKTTRLDVNDAFSTNILVGSDSQAIATTTEEIKALKESIAAARVEMDAEAVAAGFLSARHLTLRANVEEATAAFDDATSTMDSVVDANLAARLSTARVTVALKDLDTTLKDIGTRKGKFTNQGIIDLKSSFDSIRAFSTELAAAGQINAAENVLNGFRESLAKLRRDGEITRQEYSRLVNQLNIAPKDIETRVGIQGIQSTLAEINDLKATREELIAEGASDVVIAKFDADIAAAEAKFDRLNKKYEEADAKTLHVDANTKVAEKRIRDVTGNLPDANLPVKAETREAEKEIRDVLGKLPPAEFELKANPERAQKEIRDVTDNLPDANLDLDADTKKATDAISGVTDKPWKTTVDTDAVTEQALAQIGRVTDKAYRATVDTGADTSEAAGKIGDIVRKQYRTSVGVDADTSGFTSAVNSAVQGLDYQISVSGNRVDVYAIAKGGILPGYQPGKDIIPAMLSPGEAVLRPEATRALGSDFIHALNRDWNRVSRMLRDAFSGRIPKFATGGIVSTGSMSLNEFNSLTSAIVSASRTSNALQATAEGAAVAGDTYIINPAPGMDEVELAAMVSRRQAFMKRRGT